MNNSKFGYHSSESLNDLLYKECLELSNIISREIKDIINQVRNPSLYQFNRNLNKPENVKSIKNVIKTENVESTKNKDESNENLLDSKEYKFYKKEQNISSYDIDNIIKKFNNNTKHSNSEYDTKLSKNKYEKYNSKFRANRAGYSTSEINSNSNNNPIYLKNSDKNEAINENDTEYHFIEDNDIVEKELIKSEYITDSDSLPPKLPDDYSSSLSSASTLSLTYSVSSSGSAYSSKYNNHKKRINKYSSSRKCLSSPNTSPDTSFIIKNNSDHLLKNTENNIILDKINENENSNEILNNNSQSSTNSKNSFISISPIVVEGKKLKNNDDISENIVSNAIKKLENTINENNLNSKMNENNVKNENKNIIENSNIIKTEVENNQIVESLINDKKVNESMNENIIENSVKDEDENKAIIESLINNKSDIVDDNDNNSENKNKYENENESIIENLINNKNENENENIIENSIKDEDESNYTIENLINNKNENESENESENENKNESQSESESESESPIEYIIENNENKENKENNENKNISEKVIGYENEIIGNEKMNEGKIDKNEVDTLKDNNNNVFSNKLENANEVNDEFLSNNDQIKTLILVEKKSNDNSIPDEINNFESKQNDIEIELPEENLYQSNTNNDNYKLIKEEDIINNENEIKNRMNDCDCDNIKTNNTISTITSNIAEKIPIVDTKLSDDNNNNIDDQRSIHSNSSNSSYSSFEITEDFKARDLKTPINIEITSEDQLTIKTYPQKNEIPTTPSLKAMPSPSLLPKYSYSPSNGISKKNSNSNISLHNRRPSSSLSINSNSPSFLPVYVSSQKLNHKVSMSSDKSYSSSLSVDSYPSSPKITSSNKNKLHRLSVDSIPSPKISLYNNKKLHRLSVDSIPSPKISSSNNNLHRLSVDSITSPSRFNPAKKVAKYPPPAPSSYVSCRHTRYKSMNENDLKSLNHIDHKVSFENNENESESDSPQIQNQRYSLSNSMIPLSPRILSKRHSRTLSNSSTSSINSLPLPPSSLPFEPSKNSNIIISSNKRHSTSSIPIPSPKLTYVSSNASSPSLFYSNSYIPSSPKLSKSLPKTRFYSNKNYSTTDISDSNRRIKSFTNNTNNYKNSSVTYEHQFNTSTLLQYKDNISNKHYKNAPSISSVSTFSSQKSSDLNEMWKKYERKKIREKEK
eukprot:jgi/Orpsp1_1/1182409/evm.model.c7180000081165.1